MTSPFERALARYGDDLPQAFRDQYLFSRSDRVVLEGSMERVWGRGRWLTPLFWLAALFDLLFPETGMNIPVILTIRSGGAEHVWRREFRFPHRVRRFTSRMEYDTRLRRVVEAIGPGGTLAIAWDTRFEPPSRLELGGAAWVLRLGRWRLRLPRWLLGSGSATETAADASPPTIRIDFKVWHPLLGDVFGYVGTFRVRREARSPEAK